MKKLILFLACAFIISISNDVKAQSRFLPLLDTNTSTETSNITTNVITSGYGDMSIQYVGTKVTGTVAGKVYLQGSLDAVTFTTMDSLTLADVATNTKIFDVTGKKRIKYQLSVVTTGGTITNKGYYSQITNP